MTTIDIHIPKPVFTVEVDYDPDGLDVHGGQGEHVVKIDAGGVVLHEERFTSQYDWAAPPTQRRPANWVDNPDRAADKAIANFGKRLLALLNGATQ